MWHKRESQFQNSACSTQTNRHVLSCLRLSIYLSISKNSSYVWHISAPIHLLSPLMSPPQLSGFMSSVRLWEALRGLDSLVRRVCLFIFSSSFPSPVSPLSPLSLCLPQFSTFDRLTPKPCFIPAPQAVGDTSFRWRSTRRLTHYCWRTAGARIYMIFQPKAEPGSSGGMEKNIT